MFRVPLVRDDAPSRVANWGPFQISDSFLTRRPIFGTDEYYQHALTLHWPIPYGRMSTGEYLYWGLSIWLPSTCRAALRSELDSLRGWDEEPQSTPRFRVLDGGAIDEHDPRT